VEVTVERVVSVDGTVIAYDRFGSGPALVLVDGALNSRARGSTQALAEALAGRFTVYRYDRRGRGDSGDTLPYAIEREVEDLAAVLAVAGGPVAVFGHSSGAALALEATRRGLPVRRLALYEPPFVVDQSRPPVPADLVRRLESLVGAGQRGAAVAAFLRSGVDLPAPMVALLRTLPAWRGLKGLAHTLPYDMRLVAEYANGRPLPAERWAGIGVPVLVLTGGRSPAWMQASGRALAAAIPGTRQEVVAGQTHLFKAGVVGPILAEFLVRASVPADRIGGAR
jgi:pimeloyl-ACP methyl ester carboxylesterase